MSDERITSITYINPGNDGMRAKEQGFPVETCPYKPGPQRTAWIMGWYIAKVRTEAKKIKKRKC